MSIVEHLLDTLNNEHISSYGIPYSCEDLVPGSVMEGQCHSGRNKDCHGEFNRIECCEGKYLGQEVGPTDQCDWKYATHMGERVGRHVLLNASPLLRPRHVRRVQSVGEMTRW